MSLPSLCLIPPPNIASGQYSACYHAVGVVSRDCGQEPGTGHCAKRAEETAGIGDKKCCLQSQKWQSEWDLLARHACIPRLWSALPVSQMRDPRVDMKVSERGDARHKIKMVSVSGLLYCSLYMVTRWGTRLKVFHHRKEGCKGGFIDRKEGSLNFKIKKWAFKEE